MPVFVITGPSGVGKGTLIRTLRERIPELELAVSATTRQPRPGETHGVDYHFLTDDEFEDRVNRGHFVEHARYSGRRYGTLREELEQRGAGGTPVLLEIELQGARQVRKAMPEATQVFIAPPERGGAQDAARRPRHRLAGGRRAAARDRARGARRAARVLARRRQ